MYLAILWFISKMLDHISTSLLIREYGIGGEVNPLARIIYERFGDYGLALSYVFSSLIIYFVVKLTKKEKPRFVLEIITLIIIFNFIVSLHNFALYFIE